MSQVPSAVKIPTGPVFGSLRLEYPSRRGTILERAWPARRWDSVALAMQVGHRYMASLSFPDDPPGTYAVELEIYREEDA